MHIREKIRYVIAAAAMVAVVAVPATAQAEPAGSTDDVSITAVQYIPGQDVVIGSCKAWMNKRTEDGYVQGLVQSWGNACEMWLERKRLGTGGYDWTPVSNIYGVINTTASTGFHWNGTNAGSRVCLFNYDAGTGRCSSGYW
jgi:hypothetical protein